MKRVEGVDEYKSLLPHICLLSRLLNLETLNAYLLIFLSIFTPSHLPPKNMQPKKDFRSALLLFNFSAMIIKSKN